MNFWKMTGLIAAALTTFSFVPQIIKVIKKKSVKDVSLLMLLQFSAGVSFWVLYGIYLRDAIIIIANCLSLLTLVVLLALYFKFLRKEQKDVA